MAMLKSSPNPSRSSKTTTKWTTPAYSRVKTNWDATINSQSQKMGIEILISGNRGDILAYLSSSRSFNSQHLVAKFWALRKTIELCLEMGFNRVQLEGDVQVLIYTIN